MWIAAAAGVAGKEQGIASGMASTTLNIGNAIGLAVFIAVANSGLAGKQGASLEAGLAGGGQLAVFLAAAGMLAGLAVTFLLPRRATVEKVSDSVEVSAVEVS